MIERDLEQRNRSFSQPQACGLAGAFYSRSAFVVARSFSQKAVGCRHAARKPEA